MGTWSLRRRLTVLFVASSLLTTVALGIAAGALDRLLDVRSDIVDRVDPASLTERELARSMTEQEAAVFDFARTGDEDRLEPYADGLATIEVSVDRLRELLGTSSPFTTMVDDAERAAAVWRNEFAEPEIARVRLTGPSAVGADAHTAGEALFAAVQQALADLESALAGERQALRDDLDEVTWLVAGSSLAAVAIVSAAAVTMWLELTRRTLRPLEQLGRDTQLVTAGELDLPLQAKGAPEITQLAGAIEAMRRRITDEVMRVETTLAELDDRNQELTRSNSALEQFAYVASHDLQEPLRKVTSFCQLLERQYSGRLDERADQYIEFAVDGARRMQTLVDGLLEFSRVGREDADLVQVDMGDVVDRAVSDLETAVVEADAHVHVGAMPIVDGDPTLLTTLLRNLVANALKFRATEPPTVTVLATRDREQSEWRFEVADNGIGIERQHAEKVFGIFQRLHHRERYDGTGIGLAMARRIVEFHGGRIWIDTARTQGTGVCFTIPDRRRLP
jgi:signal transduction histidine kinase